MQRDGLTFGPPGIRCIDSRCRQHCAARRGGGASLFPEVLLNVGLTSQGLTINHTSTLEPRLSSRWMASANDELACGYALQSKIEPIDIYYCSRANKTLALAKSHQLLLSWTHWFSPVLVMKTEAFWMHSYDVPVADVDAERSRMLALQNYSMAVRNYGTDQGWGFGYGENAYSEQPDAVHILDLSLSYEWKKKSIAHRFSCDLINVLQSKNPFMAYYSLRDNRPVIWKAVFATPYIYYRVSF